MTKKFKLILKIFILSFFINTNSFSLSLEIEKEMYIGCYGNSKQYLGAEKAKKYCLCTIKSLGEKFNDKQINDIFKMKPEQILKKTEFAAKFCEKNINK
tara:strand:+ start:708 stop:1004 length:297 start_codon:yes stop_codon:yes gene_type:complete